MPQSLSYLLTHIVFSTKDRAPVLENVASFLGVGQFRYVLEQIGITNANEVANIINTLSHKKVYYFESDELTPDSKDLFDSVFTKIKSKYNFVLHA